VGTTAKAEEERNKIRNVGKMNRGRNTPVRHLCMTPPIHSKSKKYFSMDSYPKKNHKPGLLK
jgi:hypothetical protein